MSRSLAAIKTFCLEADKTLAGELAFLERVLPIARDNLAALPYAKRCHKRHELARSIRDIGCEIRLIREVLRYSGGTLTLCDADDLRFGSVYHIN